MRTALPDDNAVQPHRIFLLEQEKEVQVNGNLKAFFEKASADTELKDRIIKLYREYSIKEETIEQLIILASEYEIVLTQDDFTKHPVPDSSRVSAGKCRPAADNETLQESGTHNISLLKKLFGRRRQ